jgi:hypothetical protein
MQIYLQLLLSFILKKLKHNLFASYKSFVKNYKLKVELLYFYNKTTKIKF